MMGDSEWLLNPVATLCPVLRVRPALPHRRRTAGRAAGDARAQPTLEAAAAPSRVPRRSGGCWLCVCVCVKSNTVIYNRCIESPKIGILTGLTGLISRPERLRDVRGRQDFLISGPISLRSGPLLK